MIKVYTERRVRRNIAAVWNAALIVPKVKTLSFCGFRAQFHGSACREQRIGTSQANGKRISRVSREFLLVHVRTLRY